MAHCEYCGDEIGYLPFKCKYCGSIYCKKHRLPENHRCTFELKHTPVVPTPLRQPEQQYQEVKRSRRASDLEKLRGVQPVGRQRRATDFRNPKEFKKYLERERKYREKAQRIVKRSLSGRPQGIGMGRSAGEAPATTFIMFMVIICSIAAVIFSYALVPYYVTLSLYGLSQFPMYIWTIFTAPFISYSSDMFGLLFLFILIFFFYNMARSVEIRYGSKFIIGLFMFCAGLTGLFYVLIRLLLVLAGLPINSFFVIIATEGGYIFQWDVVGLASGAILGLIAFIVFFDLNREMMLLCYFIPVKMKGKTLLVILILFAVLPGLMYVIVYQNFIFFALYLPDLGGILGAYIIYKMKIQRR